MPQFLFFTVVDAVPLPCCASSTTDLHELVRAGTDVAIDWVYAFEKITNFI